MTPKQKAKELVDKFMPLVQRPDKWDKAKQCALLAVEEIIKTLNHDIRDLDVRGSVLLDLIDYWRNVNDEINKL